MMPEFAVRNVEDGATLDFCPLSIVPQENKLRGGIDKILDEPRSGDSIYFNFLASNPFHKLESLLRLPASSTRSLLLLSSLAHRT